VPEAGERGLLEVVALAQAPEVALAAAEDFGAAS